MISGTDRRVTILRKDNKNEYEDEGSLYEVELVRWMHLHGRVTH